MKRVLVIGAIVAAVVLAGTGIAMAKGQHGAKAGKGNIVRGEIVSITPEAADPTKTDIVLKSHKNTATVVADAATKVKVDKQASTVAGLKVGERIHARLANGVATKIAARTAPKAGHKAGKRHHAPKAA